MWWRGETSGSPSAEQDSAGGLRIDNAHGIGKKVHLIQRECLRKMKKIHPGPGGGGVIPQTGFLGRLPLKNINRCVLFRQVAFS